jgi:hypothetical protein
MGPSEGHSLPGDGRVRDLSGHRKKATKQEALTSWRWQERDLSGRGKKRLSDVYPLPGDGRGRDLSGNGKNAIGRGTLTSWTR